MLDLLEIKSVDGFQGREKEVSRTLPGLAGPRKGAVKHNLSCTILNTLFLPYFRNLSSLGSGPRRRLSVSYFTELFGD